MTKKKYILGLCIALVLAVYTSACSNDSVIEEEKRHLLSKINKKEKLSLREVNNLGDMVLIDGKYDEGIRIFENLVMTERYKEEKYKIYYYLSLFYAEKARITNDSLERQKLLKKGVEYINLSFSTAPEKAISFYLRAKFYILIGCKKRAKDDINQSINIAKSKTPILYEDGIYLDNNKFIKFIKEDIKRVSRFYSDKCLLKD